MARRTVFAKPPGGGRAAVSTRVTQVRPPWPRAIRAPHAPQRSCTDTTAIWQVQAPFLWRGHGSESTACRSNEGTARNPPSSPRVGQRREHRKSLLATRKPAADSLRTSHATACSQPCSMISGWVVPLPPGFVSRREVRLRTGECLIKESPFVSVARHAGDSCIAAGLANFDVRALAQVIGPDVHLAQAVGVADHRH